MIEAHAYKVSAQKFTVNVKSDVAKRELRPLEKRAYVNCTESSNSTFIEDRCAF